MPTTSDPTEIQLVPNEQSLAVARRVAAYYIGDPSWANMIVNAYLNPQVALRDLTEDMDS